MRFTFSIPDLSDLRALSQTLLLQHFFLDSLPDDETSSCLIRNLVRLKDTSVYFYQEARKSAQNFENSGPSGGFLSYFIAAGCMEASLDKLCSAMKHLSALRVRMLDSNVSNETQVDPMSLIANEQRIRQFRNELQHLDEHLVEGKINADENIALRLGDVEFSVGKHAISYAEYAGWLRQLHHSASQFIRNQ